MSASNAVGPVLWDVDPRGVATVTLNRPEVNNAYEGALIQGLIAALDAPAALRACARSFSKAKASTSRPAPISNGSTRSA